MLSCSHAVGASDAITTRHNPVTAVESDGFGADVAWAFTLAEHARPA